MKDKILQVEDLTVAYGDVSVLWKVNLEINKGNLVAVVGPNGAGKSTLIKAILGIVKKASGTAKLFGKEIDSIKERHKKISYMPQRSTVDWEFPVNSLDVVLMGRYGHLGWFKRPTKDDIQLGLDALEKFGMKEFRDKQISELSGGQQQRVFLARSYVQDADILFLDEPFGGIDLKTEQIILNLLEELRDQGKTIIVVTHDLTSLKQHFDLAVLLNIHTIAVGPPDEILTRKNLEHTYGGTLHMIHDQINGV